MIHVNSKFLEKVEKLNKNNYYVVADFDNTITAKQSNTSFSLFSKSGFYPKEYLEERTKNYEHYRPLELDPKINDEEKLKIVKEWQEASYKLLLKYEVKESDIPKILRGNNGLILRDGAIDFINLLNKNEIPLIISSAGLGNFIIELLKMYECYSENIFIYSNMLKFSDDKIIPSIDNIIHSMNKNDIELPKDYYEKINGKDNVVVIGDQLSDLNMVKKLPKENTISFGFLESNVDENKKLFEDCFDVTLTNNESFDSIIKTLKLKG